MSELVRGSGNNNATDWIKVKADLERDGEDGKNDIEMDWSKVGEDLENDNDDEKIEEVIEKTKWYQQHLDRLIELVPDGDLDKVKYYQKHPHKIGDLVLEAEKRKVTKKPNIEEYQIPLVAMNADFGVDKQELARDLAERTLNDELASSKGFSGFLRKVWKGQIAKKYYSKKYETEFLEGEKTIEIDDGAKTVEELIKGRSKGAMRRFVMSAVEEYSDEYIHKEAGETLTVADERTTQIVKAEIEKYVQADISEGENLGDVEKKFNENLARKLAEGRDKGTPLNEQLINNYFKVAVLARKRMEHLGSLERVMEGFKVYNAKVRDGVRTKQHQDALDDIVGKIGNFAECVPAEFIAGAVGICAAITRVGAKMAVGGLLFSGVLAGARERNRITADRARKMRDVATGLGYEGSEYEEKIGGTFYDVRSAKELTKNLEDAMKNKDIDAIIGALVEAKARKSFSDIKSKDLIAYSSEESRGDERLALDIAIAKARKVLPEDRQKFMKDLTERLVQLSENVKQQDESFKKLRWEGSVKQVGKTLIVGAVSFAISKGVIELWNEGGRGLLEKLGISGLNVSETNVSETPEIEVISDPVLVRGDELERIKRLRDAGYKGMIWAEGGTTMKYDIMNVKPEDSIHKLCYEYDGWANNGTSVADGNELRLDLNDGTFVSRMSGNSTLPSGEIINYEEALREGRIKGLITINGAKFEVRADFNANGQPIWGENGVFTTTTGETIKAVGDNGEKLYQYFEVAVDQGSDANGVRHFVPLATDEGANNFRGFIQETVMVPDDIPKTLGFVKEEMPGAIDWGIILPITTREGLGRVQHPFSGEVAKVWQRANVGEGRVAEVTTSNETNEVSENNEIDKIAKRKKEIEQMRQRLPENQPVKFTEGEVVFPGRKKVVVGTVGEVIREEDYGSREDFKRTRNEFIDILDRYKNELGGAEGVMLMMDDTPFDYNNFEMEQKYEKWWAGLNDDIKGALTVNLNSYKVPGVIAVWNVGLRTWLARKNYKTASSLVMPIHA